MNTSLYKEMEKFAKRKYLSRKNLVTYHDSNSWPFLHINDPAVLARFWGLLKQKVCKKGQNGWVYCRGQHSHHESMIPSLFRGINHKYPIKTLLKAQENLVEEIQANIGAARFKNENLPALLQHYGIKTSWLDLVDNLYIAIWFATNIVEYSDKNKSLITKKSNNEYGWLYFICNAPTPDSEMISVDLRANHHSLSVRPQAQHGISVTKNPEKWSEANKDLKNFVIATVRFTRSDKWLLSGYMASMNYLFPNSYIDNTLKYLKQKKIREIIKNIETKYNLPEESLGRID